jgi:hypothetical protein
MKNIKSIEFNYKKLRIAQDLNKTTLQSIGMRLLKKNNDGVFVMPPDIEIAAYINNLAEKRQIKHYVLRGEYQNIYLFDPEEIMTSLDIMEVESRKAPFVIPIQIQDERTTETDNIPFEISKIDCLFKLPKTLFNSGTCIYFLCREGKVVYVGQSENVHSRLVEHIKTKHFDNVFYLRVPANKMNKVEHALISYLKPEYNKTSIKQTNKSISLAESILNKDGISFK